MSSVELQVGFQQIEKYIRELEETNRKLAQENGQLRTSHSYRLGVALVSFAKRRTLKALPQLVREIRASFKPVIFQALPQRKRPFKSMLVAERTSDALQKAVEGGTVGTAMVARVSGINGVVVAGIFGDDIRAALGDAVGQASLPYDSYEANWLRLGITHLVIDIDHLSASFGWEHAFTLNDPAATVEMIVMLQKARQSQIETVLVPPTMPYRYPLLSRGRPFFDKELPRSELSVQTLLARRTGAGSSPT